ncbi:divalent-cation tolerance protein CutA [Niveispirillum fermenti]|uniref:divalent-cation tolerance protein CutA n=1 Tax=Niveispirillum fermenti TaxID=1233113 RepID=UPI003A8986B0
MEAPVLTYVTAPDIETARRIGAALVEERLAACVNILPGMESLYRWQGRVEQASEVVLIAKCRAGGAGALTARVRALHPYELPCIVTLPITGGLPAYLAWLVAGSTAPAQATPEGEGA